jgi:hypothetical protein
MTIGQRVIVIASDNGHVGRMGTLWGFAHGWHYPYHVRIDNGPTILTNDNGVKPIDTEETHGGSTDTDPVV